jgi:hypothetical protein
MCMSKDAIGCGLLAIGYAPGSSSRYLNDAPEQAPSQ